MSVIVRVLPSADDVFDASYVGKLGVVKKLLFTDVGVAETLDDPFIVVAFSDGRSDAFWREELEIIRQ